MIYVCDLCDCETPYSMAPALELLFSEKERPEEWVRAFMMCPSCYKGNKFRLVVEGGDVWWSGKR